MRLPILLLTCLMILVIGLPAQAGELAASVRSEVAQEVVSAVKESTRLRSIAIGEIKGADSVLIQAIEQQLAGDRHFIVVERNQLDRILKEQGIQLSDLVSEDSRVEPGRIRGVECILSGEVRDSSDFFIDASLTVFLKLLNVQNGDVLMAGEFSARNASQYRTLIIAGGVGLLVLLVAGRSMRKRRELVAARQQAETFQNRNRENAANSGIKQKVLGVIASVAEEVRRAENLAGQAGNADGMASLRRIDEELDSMRDGLITLSWNADTMKNVAQFHAGLNQMLPLAVDVADAMQAGNAGGFDAAVQALDKKMVAVLHLMTELR